MQIPNVHRWLRIEGAGNTPVISDNNNVALLQHRMTIASASSFDVQIIV